MYHLLKMGMFLYKWLVCSWGHRKHRCYSMFYQPKPGIYVEDLKYWHCEKCHDCGEELDILFGRTQDAQDEYVALNWKQRIIRKRRYSDDAIAKMDSLNKT